MGKKDYIKNLGQRNRLRISFVTERGRVVAIDVIQYEAEIGGRWLALVRYDTAHGYLHRDVMYPDGSREKLRIPTTDLARALNEAIEELERQWSFYRRVYEERMK
jgi:hypothetical protein